MLSSDNSCYQKSQCSSVVGGTWSGKMHAVMEFQRSEACEMRYGANLKNQIRLTFL